MARINCTRDVFDTFLSLIVSADNKGIRLERLFEIAKSESSREDYSLRRIARYAISMHDIKILIK
jgi:hypothetical protein